MFDHERMAGIRYGFRYCFAKAFNNRITAGIYLVDLYAKGIKDTHFVFNEPEQRVIDLMNESLNELEETTYALVHNIIYRARAFAEEHGFKPHPDFEITEYILEEDTDDVELIDIPFGINGKPVFIRALDEFGQVDEDQDEYDDQAEDDDENEMEVPLHDYTSFTDADWRDLFINNTEITGGQRPFLIDALFHKWLDKHQPLNKYSSTLRSSELRVVYDTDTAPLPYVPDSVLAWETADITFRLGKPIADDFPAIEKKIPGLMIQYPEYPGLYNHLGLCAQLKNDMISFRAINEQAVQKFLTYVYGRISLINAMLIENRLEQVPALLNNAWSLDEVIGNRKVFHITEFEDYYATLIHYFIKAGELRKAQLCFDILFDILLEECNHEPANYFVPTPSDLLKAVALELTEQKYQKASECLVESGVAAEIVKPTLNG